MRFLARSLFSLLALAMLLPLAAMLAQTPLTQPYLWLFARMGLLAVPVLLSLTQLAVALALALGLGVLLAWLANNYDFAGRRFLIWAQLAPLLLPTSLLASVFESLLGASGLPPGVRLGVYSGLSNYPLVYLLMRACLSNHNAEYWYASRSMGLGAIASLWRVGVQLNRPVLVAACLLVCMEVLSDLATPSLLGINSLAMLLHQEAGTGLVSQLALALLAALLLLVWVERLLRGRKHYVQAVAGYKPIEPTYFSRSWQELLTLGLFALPVVFGALTPLMLLLDSATDQASPRANELAAGAALSIGLACSAALLATLVACLLAYGRRFYPGPALRLLVRLASLGLVIPGLYLALALSLPVEWLDAWFAPLWQGFGLPEQLIGKSLGLTLYVLVVRFVAIALLVLLAALSGLDHELALAARSLGAGAARSFSSIELRLIAPFVGVALALVAMLALKDSGVALVLLGDAHLSLTTTIHASLMQGAIPAHAGLLLALIIALIIAVMLWLARMGLRR